MRLGTIWRMRALLTDKDIAKMRASAKQSQRRRFDQPRVQVRFEGGPLHGLKITVMKYEATGAYLAFCVVTERGPVQALYGPDDNRAVWHFTNLESGTR